MKRGIVTFVLAVLSIVVVALMPEPSGAAGSLTVSPITFNVVGLDSNNVTVGPNVYPVGARVCAAGEAATGAAASFVWDSSNALLNLEGPADIAVGDLAGGACRDVYFNVVVTRTDAAYLTAREFHISVTATGVAPVQTPTRRELFVERLVSQQRNSVNSLTGPTSISVGDIVTYTVDADTAPGGYEQLEAFLTLPSSIFELIAVEATYGTPSGATNNKVYADACGWNNDPTSPTYRSCIGPEGYVGGKAGGGVLTSFRVRAVGIGTTTLAAAIYDKSGSSYHYNGDFGRPPNALLVTVAAAPAPATIPASPATSTADSSTTIPAPAAAAGPASGEATSGEATSGGVTSQTTTSRKGSPLAATGRRLAGAAVMGAVLTALGTMLLSGLAVVPAPRRASELEWALHELRTALYLHEDDPITAAAWPLLDALTIVSTSCRR